MIGRWVLVTVLVVATTVSALSVVHAKHRHRLAFAELTALEAERDELNIEFDTLQVELATFAEAGRIEQIARERLAMRAYTADEMRVLRQ